MVYNINIYRIYRNNSLTEFFSNEIMADTVPHQAKEGEKIPNGSREEHHPQTTNKENHVIESNGTENEHDKQGSDEDEDLEGEKEQENEDASTPSIDMEPLSPEDHYRSIVNEVINIKEQGNFQYQSGEYRVSMQTYTIVN